MAVKESGGPAAFPDFSVLGGIPMMGGGVVLKQQDEEDHVDQCYSNDGALMKNKLDEKIMQVVKGQGEGNGHRRLARQLQGPMHYQVLKIKKEDSHLGEDIGEGLTSKDKLAFVHHATSQILWPRSVLPCSPLGANKATSHRGPNTEVIN